MHTGRLFLVSAPSGAGKSSLVKALLSQDKSILLSISYTSRDPRPGEMDGREYHFIAKEDFLKAQDNQEFLESAFVHGNYYGTSRRWIEDQMANGLDVLLEIDWQGAQQVKSLFKDIVSIFILPPTIDDLEWRLNHRGTDSPEVIERRLMGAATEIAHAKEFQYVIINKDFDLAVEQLQSIVTASRLTYTQQASRHCDQFLKLGLTK